MKHCACTMIIRVNLYQLQLSFFFNKPCYKGQNALLFPTLAPSFRFLISDSIDSIEQVHVERNTLAVLE